MVFWKILEIFNLFDDLRLSFLSQKSAFCGTPLLHFTKLFIDALSYGWSKALFGALLMLSLV